MNTHLMKIFWLPLGKDFQWYGMELLKKKKKKEREIEGII